MTKKRAPNAADSGGRPRLLRIGPGVVLALIASGVILWQRGVSPVAPPAPPAAGLAALPSMDAPGLQAASAPDPDWLMQKAPALKLTARQRSRLSQLHARWLTDTATLRGDLARAQAEFAHNMTGPGAHGTLESLEERARPVSQLSAELFEARRAWWGNAAELLTPQQRRTVEQAWMAHFQHRG